jgi:hypothetical protein
LLKLGLKGDNGCGVMEEGGGLVAGEGGAAMVARVQQHDGVKLAEVARVAGGWGWRRWA